MLAIGSISLNKCIIDYKFIKIQLDRNWGRMGVYESSNKTTQLVEICRAKENILLGVAEWRQWTMNGCEFHTAGGNGSPKTPAEAVGLKNIVSFPWEFLHLFKLKLSRKTRAITLQIQFNSYRIISYHHDKGSIGLIFSIVFPEILIFCPITII